MLDRDEQIHLARNYGIEVMEIVDRMLKDLKNDRITELDIKKATLEMAAYLSDTIHDVYIHGFKTYEEERIQEEQSEEQRAEVRSEHEHQRYVRQVILGL